MKTLLVVLALALIGYVGYWSVVLYQRSQTGHALVKKAVPFEMFSADHKKALLVLGDSTGVGVGAATSSESVAALFAKQMNATYVENLAVSGSEVDDLPAQIAKMKLKHYHTILLQIGANDIVAFHDASSTAARLGRILVILKNHADHVVLMSAGDVGGATVFPPPLRWYYTSLTLKYHKAFAKAAYAEGAAYVNLYSPPATDEFRKHPEINLAADGFHPSSAGYALWFQRVLQTCTFAP